METEGKGRRAFVPFVVTHGQSGTKLYEVWKSMRARCFNPKHRKWKDYGGRGIKVCRRWRDFAAFHADMSPSYREGLFLDRVDVDGDYCPANTRFATPVASANNRRDCRYVTTADGDRMTVAEASREFGIPQSTIRNRLKAGADPLARSAAARRVSSARRPPAREAAEGAEAGRPTL